MCDCDWADMPGVYEEIERTARKEHKCYECRGTIQPGERYTIHSGCWNGEFSHYKWCRGCMALHKHMGCECKVFGTLMDEARENGIDRVKASA